MNNPTICNQAGRVWPVVNRDRCLGDADCISVCPYDVLAVRGVSAQWRDDVFPRPDEQRPLRQAQVIAPDRCAACGLCIMACGQQAIILRGRYEK